MTRIVTLDPETASLSDGALAVIKAIKKLEQDVLPKVSEETTARYGLEAALAQATACRETLESLRERLMLAAAGDEPLPKRR